MFGELKFVNKVQLKRETKTSFALSGGIDTIISCSTAELETLKIVQSTIAKQLFIDEATVTPQTKFSDFGCILYEIKVEIMMALEEKFEISIGEGGAENISTVQDAADLIEKVKTAST
ncbi:Acyl carrier protein 2, chloroplastic [Glycine soja]|uniref:Carrier domain-containing protein n=2 Tax=Glycine subgen. Soja TaxID=1462606 RepID=A0A0R0FJQ1_SOYBN|nr:Acyl carrier protein 2, chloroplastic [Glycine soja]